MTSKYKGILHDQLCTVIFGESYGFWQALDISYTIQHRTQQETRSEQIIAIRDETSLYFTFAGVFYCGEIEDAMIHGYSYIKDEKKLFKIDLC